MCMSTVGFSFTEHNDYGIGYKKLDVDYDTNKPLIKLSWMSRGIELVKKQWYKAKGKKYIKNEYKSGFHIFLNIKDAEEYGGNSTCYSKVVQVHFRNVVAFGTNSTGNHDNKRLARCVIAREMKVVKVY